MSSRSLISVMLLLLQSLGLAHLAFERHVLVDGGAVVDGSRLSDDEHEGMHLCSSDVVPDGESGDECPVLAAFDAGALINRTALITEAQAVQVALISREREGVSPFTVLSLAPKSSPPALR